jgi:hypothetical protein
MADIKTVDLRGKVPDIGPIHFLRAEWKDPNSRFVLVRYSKKGGEEPEPLALRLDLDKRAILDDAVDDPIVNKAVRAHAADIGSIVIEERRAASTGLVRRAIHSIVGRGD